MWIGVSCGAQFLRIWVHGDGQTTALEAAASDPFEPALLSMIEPYLKTGAVVPVLVCGADRENHVAVPAPPLDAARAVRVHGGDLRIALYHLPGLSRQHPADLLYTRTLPVAGFIDAHPDWDGVLCLPDRHSKWVHISAGEVVSFQTFMSGEILSLLSEQSSLRTILAGQDWDGDAFDVAVSDAMSRPERVAGALFSLHAGSVLADQPAGVARARLSGMMIGMELAAARPYWLGQNLALIGSGALMGHYAAALEGQGVRAARCDVDEVTARGLQAAFTALRDSGA
ncbi:2-dehydro-3-deoxygalactonokinase [Sulfitobacter sp. F26169L]|uniref:2-dehydro-3-deoxygalactonokinase n=1 Tax=Sulfitobacter sp. F26169L TaxID=2996015 RepID=UPI002260A716|nr:2-dehydro-3-deoxygalactonokinase [Sulfitobacter sp. F26169L]